MFAINYFGSEDLVLDKKSIVECDPDLPNALSDQI